GNKPLVTTQYLAEVYLRCCTARHAASRQQRSNPDRAIQLLAELLYSNGSSTTNHVPAPPGSLLLINRRGRRTTPAGLCYNATTTAAPPNDRHLTALTQMHSSSLHECI
ncbi:unnamed protein product, partial [Ectocarpus sp. 12 AP-2014]